MFKLKSLIISTILMSLPSVATEMSAPFEDVVISIDQHNVSSAYLNQFAKNHISRRFYHGKPPEDEQKTFMLTMANQYIDQYLLAQEAKKRQLVADPKQAEKVISAFSQKYQNDQQWSEAKKYYLPMLTQMTNQKNLVTMLQQQVNRQATLSSAQVNEFFKQHPEKFTQPPQVRASLILLSVDASARGFVWQATRDQATALVEKIDNGADFAALVELHSMDPTADSAGDMGFLHQGMTSKKAEQAMADLEIGQHTKPIMLLEGVAIFKVTDRKPAQLHTFLEVEQRATALANNQAHEQAWETLLSQLRSKASIKIEQSKLLIQ